MNQELLNKYSIPVPRYTSYPPANFFHESFSEEDYRSAIIGSNIQNPQHISIYIHIPFCFQMCYYCGCNAQIYKGNKVAKNYIEALKKELQMVLPLLDHSRKISQIHYGGGTPTSQPVAVLKEINDIILSDFDCIENPEIAIECHPGYMDEKYWNDLIDAGFNRVSIGVQDFDETVLKASNRKPSRLPIDKIMEILRNHSVSVNMDFIYGLPLQTPESFGATIDKAIALNPDRIVTFSYAHVPWVNELQKNLEKVGLPSTIDKNSIYESAKSRLIAAGYNTIGLDHFVRENDELYIVSQTKTLHRNFQGYCTRRTTGQVYAFGITGISQLATAYCQNTKSLDQYMAAVEVGKLPVSKGYILNAEEQVTREVISTLMCNYTINWQELSERLNVSENIIKSSLNYDAKRLKEFAEDGIIEYDDMHITMRPEAAPFVRNIAASMDKLMLNSDKHYSKSV